MHESDLDVPVLLKVRNFKDRNANLRLAQEMIFSIRDIPNQLVLIIIDDFHNLTLDEQKNYKLLLNPKFVSGQYRFILIGQPGGVLSMYQPLTIGKLING